MGLSRQQVADAADAQLPAHSRLSANDIGKVERGLVAFPRETRRQALRERAVEVLTEAVARSENDRSKVNVRLLVSTWPGHRNGSGSARAEKTRSVAGRTSRPPPRRGVRRLATPLHERLDRADDGVGARASKIASGLGASPITTVRAGSMASP
ncbi:hypothetical protein Ato02nite_083750 [Paractinoplanes toevensis]|uniref:Uncharacterized protein n=1 Tax=Paractinoplanes toevensis TaxID=571911 RepID=A0A920BP84_9ACTN|nr:hypothetical protein Ato02nite_083750 [Actinoplanes toevensis]